MKSLSKSHVVMGLIVTSLAWQAHAGTCTSQAWSSTKQYVGGELVTYSGNEFKARYWTNIGKAPDVTQQWGEWALVQACTGTSSSAATSSVMSSSVSSAVTQAARCNWYGTTYPICTATSSGWGWENNQSCIAYADCAGLAAPYGPVTSSVSSSSIVSSSSKSSSSFATSSNVATSSSTATSSVSSSKPSSSSSVISSKSSSSIASSSSSAISSAGWQYSVANATFVAPAQLVDGVGQVLGAGSAITWKIHTDVSGEYQFDLGWATPYGVKVNSLIVDGSASDTTFDSTVPTTMTRSLSLTAGDHTFGVQVNSSNWGYMNLYGMNLKMLAALSVTSPVNFAKLPSGSPITVVFDTFGTGKLTYTVNGGDVVTYQGASPLIIPTSGDNYYQLCFGVEGSKVQECRRVTVGNPPTPKFVGRSGTQFILGSSPFYFNGSNQYYLMYKPEPMAEDFFNRAKALDMKVVRTWMFCNDNSTHDGVCINMKSNGDFILSKNEADRTDAEKAIIKRSFELFDNYVALAEARGIRLVLALGDHWNYFGNINAYGGYGTAGRPQFKAFITNLLNHVNTKTGIAYKNDPTIMMWELANEPRITPDLATFKDWVKDIAAHVKSLAPNQLVSIGMESSMGFASDDTYANLVDVNKDANVDAISAHLYPTWWSMSDAQAISNIQKLAALAREVGKPAYIGEFSWPTNEQRTTGSQTVKLSSYTNQAEVDAFVTVSLQQRATYMESWYAEAYKNRDAIGGMIIWQLSGLEWGNGGVPLRGCQWCAGPYGEPTGGWSANNDAFQFYCMLNDAEYSNTQLGAAGANTEGNMIHTQLHKASCDVVKKYSGLYNGLTQ